MSYREWKEWFLSLPWLLRWFVVLVLIRPVIDNFYELKNISPLISPLNIVGVLTPVLVIAASAKWKTKFDSVIDFYFKLWTLFIVISVVFLFIFDPVSLLFYEYLLRLTMPIYIYFFLRLLIRSKKDLHGILQTFLYSAVFVLAIFLYEVFVNPIRVVESRGLERIQGHYGDVLNYSIYLTMGFLIVCYFYFTQSKTKKTSKRMRNVLIAGGIAILMLFKINHSASYIIFASLTLLFISFNFRRDSDTTIFMVTMIVGLMYFFGQELINEKLNPLFKTDIAVYEGEKESDRLLHGRVARWRMMMDKFYDSPASAQLLGIPLKQEYPYYWISSNAHNDFLRILMLNGVLGLVVYILIMVNLYRRFRYLFYDQKFLSIGAMTTMVLYSISTTPTLYPVVLYIIYAVFAYAALPINYIKENNV